jgi:enoyl-CoA hydratase/carnithine racemase
METKTMNEQNATTVELTHQDVLLEVRGQVGLITLNRPKALNALSLGMIRTLATCLLAWRDDPQVKAVAIRGSNKTGFFGGFCAGGDIRFFHKAATTGDAELDDFFTEEYALNHLIHNFPKPYIAFMDGIVMGGGMGISQGARLRIVTQATKMAMPETHIGLFPDVGGGYFLSRCPGHVGEYLALTGELLGAGGAVAYGLADQCFDAERLPLAWDALAQLDWTQPDSLNQWAAIYSIATPPYASDARGQIDHFFSLLDLSTIVQALEADSSDWAKHTAVTLRKRSPLMLHVTLAQVRKARALSLANDLRMERDMVRHCFHPHHLSRSASQSETVEGIRALAVDKDHQPKWNPLRIEDVTKAMVEPFFLSPWPAHAHPLRDLS